MWHILDRVFPTASTLNVKPPVKFINFGTPAAKTGLQFIRFIGHFTASHSNHTFRAAVIICDFRLALVDQGKPTLAAVIVLAGDRLALIAEPLQVDHFGNLVRPVYAISVQTHYRSLLFDFTTSVICLCPYCYFSS
jgi:hypothetical protein